MAAFMGTLMIRHRTLGVSYFQTKLFESQWNHIVMSFLCSIRRLNMMRIQLLVRTQTNNSWLTVVMENVPSIDYLNYLPITDGVFSIAMLSYQRAIV